MLRRRVTRVDGRRIAIAMKYWKDAIDCDLAGTLTSIADQAFETDADGCIVPFANEYRIVTERHLDSDRVANAALVVACGGDFNDEGRQIVLDWLPGAPERFALRDVGLATGLGSRSFRVAVALIQAGAIALADPQAYLKDFIMMIVQGHPNSGIGDLMPWKFKPKDELAAVA